MSTAAKGAQMMFGDTALLRMVVEGLARKYGWSYEEAFDRFYNSDVCKGLSNRETGMFTYAPIEIMELLEEEISR
jgi:hypothetical protein